MDKEIIFSVAGSGKTTYLINVLNTEQRFLIITYTRDNCENIKSRITALFGYMPSNIICLTYFSFILSWGIKPYNIQNCPNINSIIYDQPKRYVHKKNIEHYLKENAIYHCRLYDFICEKNLSTKLISRIELFFDVVMIDEVQDFAGYDFDFIMDLAKSENLALVYVGDFFQHTFDTSRDGSKNSHLHDSFDAYKKRFEGFTHNKLEICYRCPEAICRFISDNLNIHMQHNAQNNKVVAAPKLLEKHDDIINVVNNDNIPKLFYKKASDYKCYAMTWGISKGLEFDDVCVVLNKATLDKFKNNTLKDLSPSTRNRLYVACTRTRGNLYFIDESCLSTGNNGTTSFLQMTLPL